MISGGSYWAALGVGVSPEILPLRLVGLAGTCFMSLALHSHPHGIFVYFYLYKRNITQTQNHFNKIIDTHIIVNHCQ